MILELFIPFHIHKLSADSKFWRFYQNNAPFTTKTVQLQKGDSVYTLTDGFADQFDGPKRQEVQSETIGTSDDLLIIGVSI